MRLPCSPRLRALGLAAPAACLAFAVAVNASAGDQPAPTYGVRIYEVFQRGPKVVLEERTSRAFAPNHARNIAAGEVFPPEGQRPIKVYKSRDHLEFFGSYWREDGVSEYGRHEVEVWEDAEADEAGVAHVRLRIVPRAERGAAPTRRVRHPEHDDAQRSSGK